jgi:RNA recognition motif-containing protein
MAIKDKPVKEKSKKKRSAEDDVVKAEEPAVESPTAPAVEPASPAVKRKAELEELEVNLEAPEPPSKRARRALKKGKSLPTKAASDDENDDEDEEGGKKGKERSEHGVWIGNLPFLVSVSGLKKWLVDNSGGAIAEEAITRVKIPKKKEPGRPKDSNIAAPNKGFAYVDFVDLSSKVAAVALSEAELGGRKLLIKDSTSFEGRPKKEPEPETTAAEDAEKKDASRKIFVGNMGFKTTEDDLRRNFEKCGEIEWVKLATFEDSGKCKGYGWVRFKEPEGAAWAVKGFVKIKEEIETEEDFNSDAGSDAGQEKKFKTRKWWVNRLMGRELKIELAEDDQTRYKKRFGRDAGKKGEKPEEREKRNGGDRPPRREKPRGDATSMDVARLKGTVVEHTGSKVTFD